MPMTTHQLAVQLMECDDIEVFLEEVPDPDAGDSHPCSIITKAKGLIVSSCATLEGDKVRDKLIAVIIPYSE